MKPTFRIRSNELAHDIMPDVSKANDLLCRYEEQASLWIWAYPELLGWRREIRWLFSPVVGKRRFPGDLWGIDSNSNLIIVETKLAKTDKGQDPFVDFIAFEEDQAKGLRIDKIQKRWERLFKNELEFIERHRNDVAGGRRKKGPFPGVVPYSRNRNAIWQWRRLYLGVIVPMILDDKGYAGKIRTYFAKWGGNGQIHYFGIIAAGSGISPRLSPKGKRNYDELCRKAGAARTHFRGLQASYHPGGSNVEVTVRPLASESS